MNARWLAFHQVNADFVDLLRGFVAADVGSSSWARTHTRVWDIEVDCIGRAAFIRNKRATGRARDLADIQELE